MERTENIAQESHNRRPPGPLGPAGPAQAVVLPSWLDDDPAPIAAAVDDLPPGVEVAKVRATLPEAIDGAKGVAILPHLNEPEAFGPMAKPFVDDPAEAYAERSAICEFDGGLSRDEAERQAATLTGYEPGGDLPGWTLQRVQGGVALVAPGHKAEGWDELWHEPRKAAR